MSGWQVGIDTGGTYTDLIALREAEVRLAKVPSTPPTYEDGILAAIKAAGLAFGDIELIAHGTTVATNAVITSSGAPTALLTTRGFRDVLQLGRHNRGEPYDILWDPPAPLVPRRHRYEVTERLDWAGGVVTPLNEEDVRIAVRHAARAGIRSFAICFLHSYANPSHEERAHAIVKEECPEAFVCHSAELLREPQEFERTSTTVINAYLMPVVSEYLEALARRLAELGFRGELAVMHSGGGLISLQGAIRLPARLVTSGPAAGARAAEGLAATTPLAGSPAASVIIAEAIAREEGLTSLISLDMGGTSADIAVVRDRKARIIHEYAPQFGQPIRFPAIDLVTIGAGGGSIAWVDSAGLPHVGPGSAGARPGPAAYGQGGELPTVTDANVVLGRLPVEAGLAGGIQLHAQAARAAVGAFASATGLSLEAAALGIVEICNNNMARSIRVVTVNRGLDPRDFWLVPLGGAGPLHAAELAEILGIRRIIVPLSPGLSSALGCLNTDITHDLSQSWIVPLAEADKARLEAILERLRSEMRVLLDSEGVPESEQQIEFGIDLRYLGQVRSLTIPMHGGGLIGDAFREELAEHFYAEYQREFHSYTRDIPIEVAAVRLRGRRRVRWRPLPFRTGRVELRPYEQRVITKDGEVTARVIDRSSLASGTRLCGPLIVTQEDSTTWVPPNWSIVVDANGNLVMTLEG